MLEPLTCPQCGAPLRAGANKCDYCDTGFAGTDTRAQIAQVENEIAALRFRTFEEEMSAVIAHLIVIAGALVMVVLMVRFIG